LVTNSVPWCPPLRAYPDRILLDDVRISIRVVFAPSANA